MRRANKSAGGKIAMSDKEMVIEAVRQLPEHANIKEITEEIAILAAIKKGGARH
jgi:hypothetical protein